MARELIADTEFYTIEVDSSANRSFSVYRGFWPETEEFRRTYLANIGENDFEDASRLHDPR